MKVKQMISNGMTYAHVVRKGNLNFHVVIRVLYSVIFCQDCKKGEERCQDHKNSSDRLSRNSTNSVT